MSLLWMKNLQHLLNKKKEIIKMNTMENKTIIKFYLSILRL